MLAPGPPTAMRTQLLDRYLTGTGTVHGIYLVFWFASDDWDPSDGRRRRCADDPEELAQTLLDQAQSITQETHADGAIGCHRRFPTAPRGRRT